MKIELVAVCRPIMEMRRPFTTSFSTPTHRDLLIIEACGGGEIGYGECVSSAEPLYSEEFRSGCAALLAEALLQAKDQDDIRADLCTDGPGVGHHVKASFHDELTPITFRVDAAR